MKSMRSTYLLLALLLVYISANLEAESSTLDNVSQQPGAKLISSLVEFTGNLFNQMRKNDENLIVSPLSLHRALNFLLIGADNNSQTQKELMDVLGYKKPFEPFYESHQQLVRKFAADKQQASKLNSANSKQNASYPILDIWDLLVVIDSDVGQNYRESIKRHFESASIESIRSSDSEAKSKMINRINGWGKSVGFESDLLEKDELEHTKTALYSAIKAQVYWFKDFMKDSSDVKFNNFGQKSNLSAMGKFMHRDDMNEAKFFEFCQQGKGNHESLRESFRKSDPNMFDQFASLNIRAINIPLRGNVDLIMLEPLSFEKGDELNELSRELASVDSSGASKLGKILNFIDTKDSGHKFDSLSMPKFKFQTSNDLKSSLQAMNLRRIFDEEAELHSILERPGVSIETIKQNAVIDLDEHGVKVAAITQLYAPLSALTKIITPIDLVVQNPFIFLLRYERIPLFTGQLVKL